MKSKGNSLSLQKEGPFEKTSMIAVVGRAPESIEEKAAQDTILPRTPKIPGTAEKGSHADWCLTDVLRVARGGAKSLR